MLHRIDQFVKHHKHEKILLGTGDTNQLPTIEPMSNTKSFEEYANECVSIIFENEIFLKECKRLKNPEDKVKLKNIKNDIL